MEMKISGMSIAGFFNRTKNGLNKRIGRVIIPLILRPKENKFNIVKLGVGDGSWAVALDLLGKDAVCYCVGVGTDASFDISLAELGCSVHSFDPTPMAMEYAKSKKLFERKVNFHPIGVWSEDTMLKFFAPSNSKFPNYSTKDLHGTGKFIEARCMSLAKIMKKLGHENLSLLKLDIEGSWNVIIDSILKEKIFPDQICVEFDSPTSVFKIFSIVNKLNKYGYELINFSKEDYLFIIKSDLK